MIAEQIGASEAEKLLEELEVNSLPISPQSIVHEISHEGFSVVLESKAFRSNDILGAACGDNSSAIIYVNSKITNEGRYNFTAAHELGHVCLHIMTNKVMSFECGNEEFYNAASGSVEEEANGFASSLLMPRRLINPLLDEDINWKSVHSLHIECKTSREATVRRLFKIFKEPYALIIHKNKKFVRFVPSDNFAAYIHNVSLSQEQIDLCMDGLNGNISSEFDEVDAADWVNPNIRGETLYSIHSSSVSLENGYVYTLLKYDDDCFEC